MFFLLVASYAYARSNFNVGFELSLNSNRLTQRDRYGPWQSQGHGYDPVSEFKPRRYHETTNPRVPYSAFAGDSGRQSPYYGRRSRLPDPYQEGLLKIPATSNCRCYNNDPVQGRIRYQPHRGWFQRLVGMAYYR